jgi:aerobic-type carbon monoxide dehydrogenase small subunit (CoxS/CutS family)
MVQRLTLTVNGNVRAIAVDDPDMPLLYVLRDDICARWRRRRGGS